MMKFVSSNVLVSRLAKRMGCLASSIFFRLAIVLGILANLILVDDIFSRRYFSIYVWGNTVATKWLHALCYVDPWISISTVLVALWMPIYTAYVALMLTVNYVRSTEYPLVCATAISDKEISSGFLLAVLYHCRAILVLFGLLVLRLVLVFNFVIPSYMGPWPLHIRSPLRPGLPVVFESVSTALLIYVGWLGICLLAATLNVWLGVWWRRLAIAPVVLMAIASLEVLLGYYLGMVVINSDLAGFLLVPFILGTYATAFGCLRLAQYWVRR